MTDGKTENEVTPRVVGRYALFDEIASGGMATVHIGRLVGQVGFSRTVAVKRLHPQYAKDEEFVSMFVDEARLASRIQHPNVVSTLDVVKTQDELFLVMEYVQGEALSRLVRLAARRGERLPPEIVVSVMSGMLHGLHAAHEAKSETREPLNIVHRDISPQNVLVGVDGVARVLDFGVAKAALRSGATRDGQMKGKLSYMSPEQLNGREVDRRGDVFAAGVVLWEALAGKRLFAGADAGEILAKVLAADITPPHVLVPAIPRAVSDAVMRALQREPEARFQTARDFAVALEQSGAIATTHAVGEWVRENGGDELAKRANIVAQVESHPMDRLAELQARRELEDETSDRTSGVLPPVHGEIEGGGRPRFIVTATMIAMGAGLGLFLGFDLFNGGAGPSSTVAQGVGAYPGQLPSVELPQPPPSAVPDAGKHSVQGAETASREALGANDGPEGAAGRANEPPPQRPPRPRYRPSRPDCRVPWKFVNGIKKPKPECL